LRCFFGFCVCFHLFIIRFPAYLSRFACAISGGLGSDSAWAVVMSVGGDGRVKAALYIPVALV
jgi:hypothetical protein